MSAPASRAATVSERSGRGHKHIAEWELEPLRQAIQQIDDQFQHENVHKASLQHFTIFLFSIGLCLFYYQACLW